MTQTAQVMGDIPKEVQEKLDAGFAKIQGSAECKSLLKKYLTKEVYEELKGSCHLVWKRFHHLMIIFPTGKKTGMGATLLDVVQSGFENLDSGIGLYAPDADSYQLFENLFNPVIEEYHFGFKATDKHPASDFGNPDTLVNLDPNSEFIISTRVRCGRSLKGWCTISLGETLTYPLTQVFSSTRA